MTIPVGIQLYSLRDDSQDDFYQVLKNVAAIGYEGVEFAGYFGYSSKELKKVLCDLGLKAVGSHIGYDQLDKTLDEVIQYNLEIGSKYIVCPGAPGDKVADEKGWKWFAEFMNEVGEKCLSNGLQLCYHNHDWELKKIGYRFALDIFYSSVDFKYVKAELDLGWVLYAGVDPVQYLNKFNDNCPLVHIKDFGEDKKQTEVGTGILDLDAVCKGAVENNVKWLLIETEEYNMAPVDSVKVGFNNLLKYRK